ncbi:hypothetical protein RB195_012517 [Necator americanus]|uniref:Reverse transcriptase domain-containing protein n=1 Tax=Necator americanus TaxID=51031 RepID=A0ABR1D7I1_NECAM
MLTEFDETCECIGLQLNLQKTIFMRNGWVSDAPFKLIGTNMSECTSCVYLGRELNIMNDLTSKQGRKRRAAWRAFKSIKDVVKKTRKPAPCSPLQHHRTSCFDLRSGNLGISQAGRKRGERH